MFDNITVKCSSYHIPNLTVDYLKENRLLTKIRGMEYSFKLFNPNNLTESYLKIVAPQEDNPTFKIVGSIRKWYCGNTLDDLSKLEYKDAWKQVFSLLGIPFCKMRYFSIASAEIGLNVLIKTPCSEITNAVIGYKSSRYRFIKREGEGCKYKSKTKDFTINLYDKIQEITNTFKNKRIKSIEEIAILEKYNSKNALRIEFSIKGGKAMILKKLGFNTLEDSIDHFETIYLFFWNNVQELQFNKNCAGIPVFNPEGKQRKELMRFLILLGIEQSSFAIISDWTKRMKHGRSTLSAIKKLMRESTFENNSYGENELFKDVKIQIIYAMKKSRCILGNVKKLVRKTNAA